MTKADEWDNFRFWQRAFVASVLMGPIVMLSVPSICTVVVMATAATPEQNEAISLVVAVVVLLWFGISGIRFTLLLCPRCSQLFFVKRLYGNQLAAKCVHCGQAKWQPVKME
jgi:hypothetical protein